MTVGVTQVRSLSAAASERPLVALLPGGPGLSSATLRSLDRLSRSFDLLYVDPPGTGGAPELTSPTFAAMVQAIEKSLLATSRPMILAGHSYGGLYTAALAASGNVDLRGLVFLSAPLRPSTYVEAVTRFGQLRTPQLEKAEREWLAHPCEVTFKEWLASYGTIYFERGGTEAGAALLRADRASSQVFLALAKERIPATRAFAEEIAALTVPKLMFAGVDDPLFPPHLLEGDAAIAHARFAKIPDASHFLMFDQPEAVVRQIESWWLDSSQLGVPVP